jgi:hypothetical protein
MTIINKILFDVVGITVFLLNIQIGYILNEKLDNVKESYKNITGVVSFLIAVVIIFVWFIN